MIWADVQPNRSTVFWVLINGLWLECENWHRANAERRRWS